MTNHQMAAAIASSMKKFKKMAADYPGQSNHKSWSTAPLWSSVPCSSGPEGVPGTPDGAPSLQASPPPPPSQPTLGFEHLSPPALPVPADFSSQLGSGDVFLQPMPPAGPPPPPPPPMKHHPWAASAAATEAAKIEASSAKMAVPPSAPGGGGSAEAGADEGGQGKLGSSVVTPSPSDIGGGSGGGGGASAHWIKYQNSGAVDLEEEANKTE